MEMKKDKIVKFIERRFRSDCDWLTGNCYYFATILIARFPQLEMVYLPVTGHFMAVDYIKRIAYDYAGAIPLSEIKEPIDIVSHLMVEDPLLWKRLVRDCIN